LIHRDSRQLKATQGFGSLAKGGIIQRIAEGTATKRRGIPCGSRLKKEEMKVDHSSSMRGGKREWEESRDDLNHSPGSGKKESQHRKNIENSIFQRQREKRKRT